MGPREDHEGKQTHPGPCRWPSFRSSPSASPSAAEPSRSRHREGYGRRRRTGTHRYRHNRRWVPAPGPGEALPVPPPPPQPPSSLTPSRYHAAGAAAAASSAASSPPAPRRRRGRRGRAAPGVGSGGGGGRRRTLAETGRSEEHRSRRRRWGRTCGSRWISERIPPTPHPGRFPSIPVERSVSRPGAKARGAEGIAPRNRLPSKEEQGGIATSFRSASLGLQPGSAQGLGRELGRELGRLARSALGLPTPRRRLFIIIPLSLLRPLLGT